MINLAVIYRRTRNLVPANFGQIVRNYVKNVCAQLQSWGSLLRCAACEDAQILGKTGHITNEEQTHRNVLFTAKTNKKLMKYRYIQRPTNFGRRAFSKYGATTQYPQPSTLIHCWQSWSISGLFQTFNRVAKGLFHLELEPKDKNW
jgi:hypothetical protein